jgi:hypothetical protein
LFLKLLQQPCGVLDFVADDDGRAVWGRRVAAIERPPRDGDDLVEIVFESCFLWRLLLPLRFQKQLRLGENPFARLLASGVAPGAVERFGLPRGPVAFREDPRHALAMFHVDARHRSQIPHGDLRGDAPFAHLLLHRFRQRFHQRQTARDPTRATVETARQFLDRAAVLFFQLRQQPALFERAFRLAVVSQRMNQHQRFGLAHRVQNQRIDRVATELLERGDALVTIDHQILLSACNHDDRRLLTRLSQRRQQLPVSRRLADPEMLQAAVQLVKLQRLRHGFQYAPTADWSFSALRSCCSELVWDQSDSRGTGLSLSVRVVRT